ncbi:MAG TPA: flagella basal body P-ring formation protein FlgA [Legionella sp.]|nr:flagella basal body P-ring formation protein FlgA [Legionella sp.]
MKFASKPFEVILSLMFLFAFQPSAAADTVLRFQPNITPKATLLGDLLVIQKDVHHWSQLPLDSHPNPGETITHDKIMAWMTTRLGPLKTTWVGKTHIVVTQSVQTTGSELITKAKAALIHQLAPQYTRVEVTALTHLKDSEYALDDFKTEVTQAFPTSKRVCVWLVHKNHQAPRLAVWFNVRAHAPVWVATHDVRSNTLLTQDMFQEKEQNIAGLNAPPAQSIPEHHWLKSSLARHAVLLENQLKAAPLITHGQRLKVFAHHHSITVVMEAIALSDGYLGDTITVKNPLNQKTFAATIQGFQHAEIAS